MNVRLSLRDLAVLTSAAATLLSFPDAPRAQTCFQRVGGVPGAYGQPPDWWSSGAVPLGSMTGRFVDDPRWQGATSLSHIGDTGRFRALVETTSGGQRALVLSWHVKVDPSGVGDRLYVGFWDETSNQGNVFRLGKTQSTATPVGGGSYTAGAFNGRFFHRTSAAANVWVLNNMGGTVVPPLPTWLKNDTRVDVFCPSGPCDEWAVRMRVPIDPAADVTSDNPTGVKITAGGVFRFWYQIQDEAGVGTAVLYGWPGSAAVASESNPPCAQVPPTCFPDPLDATNGWTRVQDGATCQGEISIVPSQIYANSPGSITVNLTSGNTLYAHPTNNMAATQPGNGIKATFRLANWGSSIGASPEWRPICSDVLGDPGAIPGSSPFTVRCLFTVPDPCPYRPAGDPCGPTAGSRNPDQCMLVDLASAPGSGPYHFSPQSAWRNMLFIGASVVTKTAVLDAQGLPPLPSPAPNRDLYVYVKARNLPAEVNPNAPLVDVSKLPGEARERLARLKIEMPGTGAAGQASAARIAEAMGRGQITSEEAEALLPTYVAHVWHDTGQTLVGTGGASLKLLAPQPAFGLHVWHDGTLHGWRHAFEGASVTAVAPGYYRVSVPSSGTARVTTSVTACERPGCGGAPPWWLWLLLLLVVLLLLGLWLLKKRTPAGT